MIDKDLWAAFDEIFCLTLDGDVERQRHASDELNAVGLGRFSFIGGIKANAPEVAECFRSGQVSSFPPCFRCGRLSCGRSDCNNTLIEPQVACFLSYLKIFRRAANCGSKSFFVVEDDVKFHEYFRQLAAEALSRERLESLGFFSDMPCLIGLGRALDPQIPPKYTGESKFLQEPAPQNPCFAFNRAFAVLALDRFAGFTQTADVFIHFQLATAAQAYSLHPPLAYELSWSTGALPSRIHPKALAFENEANPEHVRNTAKAAFERHLIHTRVVPLTIIGAPRGGTGFMAKAMQSLGFDIGHEALGADGISSWLFAVSDTDLPFGADLYARNSRFVYAETTLAVIRIAPEAIFATQLENAKNIQSYSFRRHWILKTEGVDVDSFHTAFERALATYVYWYRLVARRHPTAWIRLEHAREDVDAFLKSGGLAVRSEVCAWPGIVNDRKPYFGHEYSRPTGDFDQLMDGADDSLRLLYSELLSNVVTGFPCQKE